MTSNIGRIGTYRSAFRQILRHRGLDPEDRVRGLMNLVGRAHRERYAELILGAMLGELLWSIDQADVLEERSLGDVMEVAARKLRAEGRQECPSCCSPLSGPVDWDHWRALREAAIREAEAREGAIA